MTIQIKHAFVSLKGDGTDSTQVQPSNWNAVHALTLASGNLVGRLTAGAGAAEEIPVSAYMASLFGAADASTLAGLLGLFETGDVKFSFKTSASAGWLLIQGDGTIGDASSGATVRANADVFALYTLIYNACVDALAPVTGGRSGNATTDFNAHKPMAVPTLTGRSPMGAGFGTGVFGSTLGRTLGQHYGEESHVLTVAELATHTHANTFNDPGHLHAGGQATSQNGFAGGSPSTVWFGSPANTTSSITNASITNAAQGSNTAHNTIHPVIALNTLVKL
jgi:microcystin-dependent protein